MTAATRRFRTPRTVEVIDTIDPVVTITGDNPLQWVMGTPWGGAPSATATDSCDGDLTAAINVNDDGPLNVNVPGMYTFTYSVSDTTGNTGSDVLTVEVTSTLAYTVHPVVLTNVYTDDAAFDLSATYDNGANAATCEWFRNGSGLGSAAAPDATAGTVTTSVDPAALGAGYYDYYVEIVDDNGTWASNTGTVNVYNIIALSTLDDVNASAGDPVSVTVTATGGMGSRHYQWYKDGSPMSDTANVSGTSTATLSIAAFDSGVDTGDYYVVVTDDGSEVRQSNTMSISEGTGMPVAGGLGLAALALAAAAAGAWTVRRRK